MITIAKIKKSLKKKKEIFSVPPIQTAIQTAATT